MPSFDIPKRLHASQHAAGGSDPITPASIGAASQTALNGKADKTSTYTKTEADARYGRASGWLDPRDYGVVGDGVTNDSVAWSAFWTNIVPATGGRVVIHTPVFADPFVVQDKTNLTVECKPSGGLIMRDHDGGSTANRVGIKFLRCDGLRFDMQVWGDRVLKRVSETQPQSPLQVVSSVDVRGRGIGWDVRGGFVFVDVEDWTLTVEGEGFGDAPFYHRKVRNGHQYVAARRIGVDWQREDYNGTAGGYRNHCAGIKLREDCDNIAITGWIDDVQGNGAAVGLTQGCSRIRVHDMMLTNVGSPWGVNTASATGKLNSDIMLERVRITARPEASLVESTVAHFDPAKPGMTVRDSTITGFDRSIALPHRSERITISDNPATTGYGAHMGIDQSVLTSSVIANLGNRGLWVLANDTTVARNHFHNIPQQALVREAGKVGPQGTTADRVDSNTYTKSPVTNWFK